MVTSKKKIPYSHYLAIEQFTRMIKKSKLLDRKQKDDLWKQARNGDLEGARKEYKKLTNICN